MGEDACRWIYHNWRSKNWGDIAHYVESQIARAGRWISNLSIYSQSRIDGPEKNFD